MIYLDCAATTQPNIKALTTFYNFSKINWFNPGSRLYSTDAANIIETSRSYIADIVGAQTNSIIFTSGATEAANMLMRGAHWDHVILSAIEHPCVYKTACSLPSADIHFVKNDADGKIDLVNLADLLEWCADQGGSVLVAIMGANNELGTIQPVEEIGNITHCYRDAYYFCDTTQLWPHEKISLEGIDYACMSAHKFGGLKGTGFLYVGEGAPIKPLLTGGHQEGGLRAGTENVGGIAAMAEALKITERDKAEARQKAEEVRKRITALSASAGIRINGGHDVVQNIVSLTMPDCDAQKMVAALAMNEIYIAAGSACSTGSAKPSRVLLATGMSEEEARRTIRISFDSKIRLKDIDTVFKQIELYRGVLKDDTYN